MISAGNDVVSLAAIDVTRTNQHRFYSKILSEAEIPLYNEFDFVQTPFEIFVWLLWSVKESAYKFLQRNQPGLLFTPVKFVVTNLCVPNSNSRILYDLPIHEGIGFEGLACIKSTIVFKGYTLYSYSVLYHAFIHSVVNNADNFESICWGVKKIKSDDTDVQSAEVRSFLLERLGKLYGDNFKIEKNQLGCPILLRDGKESPIPLSLSHHGRFVGYSFKAPLSP